MLVKKAVQLAVLAAALLLDSRTEAATTLAVKVCGRQLSHFMSKVCQAYNSPNWDAHTVVEQPGAMVRRRPHVGIADQCCQIGCTWDQFSEYCAVRANSESPLENIEAHIIEGRSAEQGSERKALSEAPVVVGSGTGPAAGQVGRRSRARGRRCWCRRRRRSGRRRSSLMGNMEPVTTTSTTTSAPRAAPVVGTVSPLITWGRILSPDLSAATSGQYAYVVYT